MARLKYLREWPTKGEGEGLTYKLKFKLYIDM